MASRKLTTRFVETVSTGLDREDFRDAAIRGLQLRVTKGGAKSWTFRYRRQRDGRLRRVTLGTFPAKGLDEARQIILATHVGGEVLTHWHGYPARGVAPFRSGGFG